MLDNVVPERITHDSRMNPLRDHMKIKNKSNKLPLNYSSLTAK